MCQKGSIMDRYDYDEHYEICPKGKGSVVITVEKVNPVGTIGYKIIGATCNINEAEWSNCHSECPLIHKYSYSNPR